MLRLEMLEADHGDCLWLEYGDPLAPHRVLIDGGTPSTYQRISKRIASLPEADRRFELFVVTHIDSDHIGGAVKLLEKPPPGLAFSDVWFNGFEHLPVPPDEMGVRQGEALTKALEQHTWNGAFHGGAVMVPQKGPLPRVELPGGLNLTVLSPGYPQLLKLYPQWDKALAKLRAAQSEEEARKEEADLMGGDIDIAALAAAPYKEDKAVPNGSSIALLAEYEGKRLLMGADAFPGVLADNIDRLLLETEDPLLRVDAFKVCHHGSRANTSKKLLDRLSTNRYLISTNGDIFEHPDREGISRLIAFGGREKALMFNYRTEFNEIWDNSKLKNKHGYDALYQSTIEL